MLKCYRVWFGDGSAILCDAENNEDARNQGNAHLVSIEVEEVEGGAFPVCVEKIECLTV